nr:MAG TPA: hypothetical protein [Caudoviricetes sp.]
MRVWATPNCVSGCACVWADNSLFANQIIRQPETQNGAAAAHRQMAD